MAPEGVGPRDEMPFLENSGLDQGFGSNIANISHYEPVKKSLKKALSEEDKDYKDIIKRSSEVDRRISNEHSSVYDPLNSYIDKIKYKISNIRRYFDSYSDELFSMLMEKLPYKKGAAASRICDRALEDFDPSSWNEMINEEYEDSEKVAELSLGVEGAEDCLQVFKEPEAKKLLKDSNNTLDSVLSTRIISYDPDILEKYEMLEELSDEIYNKYKIDPTVYSTKRLLHKGVEREDTDLSNLLENLNDMNKIPPELNFYIHEASNDKRKEYALTNTFELLNEDFSSDEKSMIERTIVAFPHVINVSPKIIHERYNRRTVDSPPGTINKGDYMELVGELRYKDAKRETGLY